jgi:hypothetical protein
MTHIYTWRLCVADLSLILQGDRRSKLAIPTYAKSRIGIKGRFVENLMPRSCHAFFFHRTDVRVGGNHPARR